MRAAISLRLAHPLPQRLRVDAQIRRDVLERQPHAALQQLLRILPRSRHDCGESPPPGQHPGIEVSVETGLAQTATVPGSGGGPHTKLVTGSQAPQKARRQRTTPPSSTIFTRRGSPLRRGKLIDALGDDRRQMRTASGHALATIGEAARTALDEAAVEADRRGMRARKILATLNDLEQQ